MKRYIISVRLQKGCYRHINVCCDTSLEEFADIILWSFDFFNDHAHAFFMNNKIWTDEDAYYASWIDEDLEYRHTCDYNLNIVSVGQSFKFVFDFGEDWTFQCKVLREANDKDNADCFDDNDNDAYIVRALGEAPQQYYDYSDKEFED